MGGVSAEVVSIGIGGSHRPDYSHRACGQVAAARRVMGMDLKDFAEFINDMTGWDVLPSAVGAWESDVIPPGDVVEACLDATQGMPAIAASLLAAVPPAFPAEALAGPWVTTYEFTHAGVPHYHADIAHVVAESESHVRAVNHPPEPRSQGRRQAFRNEIAADLHGRHLIGQWRNISDHRYCGSLQLAVLPGETVMEGIYTGVGSDVEVSKGFWRWVRLDAGPDAELGDVGLREPSAVYDLVMKHSQYGEPLTLADVREET